MINIRELTERYISYFHTKDIDGIEALMHDTFALEDPTVKRISGKKASLAFIRELFSANNRISFCAKNIFIEKEVSLIEFELKLDELTLLGVDIIEWREGKMCELRAYLNTPN